MSRKLVRGQLFTTDAVFAIVFLISLLAFYSAASKAVALKLAGDESRSALSDAADTASLALFSPDTPAGLLNEAGFVSSEKMVKLAQMEPERSRQLLGLYRQGSSFDYSLSITDFKGNALVAPSSANLSASESSLTVNRFAVLDDGRPLKISLVVWGR